MHNPNGRSAFHVNPHQGFDGPKGENPLLPRPPISLSKDQRRNRSSKERMPEASSNPMEHQKQQQFGQWRLATFTRMLRGTGRLEEAASFDFTSLVEEVDEDPIAARNLNTGIWQPPEPEN